MLLSRNPGVFFLLCTYLRPAASNVVCGLHRPSPVIESEPPFIELSMAANKLKRSVLCINGVTNDRHFDKTCFAFMAFTRGNICLAINLITKCHKFPSVFNLSLYFYSFFCGDSSDSAPTYLKGLLQISCWPITIWIMTKTVPMRWAVFVHCMESISQVF